MSKKGKAVVQLHACAVRYFMSATQFIVRNDKPSCVKTLHFMLPYLCLSVAVFPIGRRSVGDYKGNYNWAFAMFGVQFVCL